MTPPDGFFVKWVAPERARWSSVAWSSRTPTLTGVYAFWIRGTPARALSTQTSFRSLRLVAARSDGVIAAAHRFDYSVEIWDNRGGRLVDLHHEESLNEAEVRPVPYNLTDHPPPHEVIAVHFDDADRLWILFHMMRDGWERYYEPHELPGGLAGISRLPDTTLDSVHESRLDVIDLQSGTVVARSRLPGHFEAFVGDGLLLQYRELPTTEQLAVWRVTIDGR